MEKNVKYKWLYLTTKETLGVFYLIILKKILEFTQIWLDDEKKGGTKKKIFPCLLKFTEVRRSFFFFFLNITYY